MQPPTLNDVYAARERVYRVLRPTPLMRHPLLSAETGLDIWVKHENHNPTPAVANAIFAATGKRIRTLPLAKSGFSWA